MKKTYALLAALMLLAALALAGCGSKSAGSSQSETTNPGSSKETAISDEAIKEGTTKLIATAEQLQEAAAAGDEAKVKELGPKLEEGWSAFEDGVKPKFPDLYEKVEQYLDPTIAGTQASPMDKDALLKLNDSLTQALNELLQSLK